MPRQDIEFKTSDHVTLRGWFYTPEAHDGGKLPAIVLAHGFSALKEFDLDAFAEYFVSKLPIAALVYDNRGFGDSDQKDGEPRLEIVPSLQISDYSDAITYVSQRPEVDADRIAIWGSSYSGGHVLYVGAVDRRVKAVLSQVPLVSGWENFHRLVRPDFAVGFNATFAAGMWPRPFDPHQPLSTSLRLITTRPDCEIPRQRTGICPRGRCRSLEAICFADCRQPSVFFQLGGQVQMGEQDQYQNVSLSCTITSIPSPFPPKLSPTKDRTLPRL